MPIENRAPKRRSHGGRLRLWPLAIAMLSLSVHAADGWVETDTKTALQPVDTLSAGAPHSPRFTALVTPLQPDQPLHLVIGLKLRNQAQLDGFLRDLNRVGSPVYGKLLTPAQFKAAYGPTDAQVQAVVAHLQQAGFRQIKVAPNNLLISADANAASVSTAFRTQLKQFVAADGQRRYANDTPAQVPPALAGIVGAVLGLDNLHGPRAASARPTSATYSPQAPQDISDDPASFATIYDVGNTPTGAQTPIALICQESQANLISYLNQYTDGKHWPRVDVSLVRMTEGMGRGAVDLYTPAPCDPVTIAGVAGGMSKLTVYVAAVETGSYLTEASLTAMYNRAVTDDTAKIIESNYGQDETLAHDNGAQAANDAIFQQAVAQGQVFIVPSGDFGVYEAYAGNIYQQDLSKYSVAEPASSPYVVAVGATVLTANSDLTWASERVMSYTADYWQGDAYGSGGGISQFENAPSWQTSALGSAITHRVLPDLAFAGWYANGNGGPSGFGYSEVSSAIFAGIWARIESANSNSLGLPTERMYQHFSKDPSPTHDIVGGYNGVYVGGNPSFTGYRCTLAWDYCTGWGSLDIAKFSTYVTQNWNTPDGNLYASYFVWPIPDLGSVAGPITVNDRSGNASATLTVTAKITHPHRGDLRITLVAPNGTRTVLKQPDPNDGGANVDQSWTVNGSAVPAGGTWQLWIDDAIKGNTGALDQWSLTF